jgi:ribosome-associated protein
MMKDNEYIELNKLLKITHLVSTGGEANMRIDQGEVLVNGQTETRRRNKLRPGDKVTFGDQEIMIK